MTKADEVIGNAFFFKSDQAAILDMICEWQFRKIFNMNIREPDFTAMVCGHDTLHNFGIALRIHERGAERLEFIHVANPLVGGELGAVRDYLLYIRLPAEEVLMILQCFEGNYPDTPIYFKTT